jgi:hypothetical protein
VSGRQALRLSQRSPASARRLGSGAALLALLWTTPAVAWGERGHELVNEAAARSLPPDVPECLRDAAARLTYLGPEPDRWRIQDLEQLNRGARPDHFGDLELLEGVVDPADPPPHRHSYSNALHAAGLDPYDVGYGPYRAIELCQRLEASVAALGMIDPDHPDAAERRRQAEEAIVYTAGVLGHYVSDLANPHHCTIHYNGWQGENPAGFATDRDVHARFESDFVERLTETWDLQVRAPPARDLDYARAVWGLAVESNGLVRRLYTLDLEGAFAPGNEEEPVGRRGRAFAEARMVRGATVLRDLWITACARGLERSSSESLRRQIEDRLDELGISGVRVRVDRDRRVTLSGVVAVDVADQALVEAVSLAGPERVTSRLRVR